MTKNSLRYSVASSAILTALSFTAPTFAQSYNSQHDFYIQPQPLEEALIDFSEQSGVQVIASSKLISGLYTNGYVASGPVDDALGNLLQSTGLTYVIKENDVITIVPASEQQPVYQPINASTTYYESGLAVYDRAEEADIDNDFEEIVIEGKKYYRHKEASSGTKMNMQLKDTPQSIKVITADVIEAASIKSFQDIYKVDASGGTSHAVDSFPRNYYRGFRQQSDSSIKVDGFRFTADVDLDIATYERFEVVKGPTSTLYGQNGIGGTLNAVSKKPEDEFGLEVSGEIGSHDSYRGDLDITGPITEDGTWSYRLITAYEDTGSFLEFGETSVFSVSPSLKYQPTESTSFLARVDYQKHKDVPHWGGPFQRITDDEDDPNFNAVQLAKLPRSHWFGMPWNSADRDVLLAQITAEHMFDNGWILKSNVQYNKVTKFAQAFSNELADSNGNLNFASIYANDLEDKVFSGEVNLFGDVEAFGQDHTLFFGVDYSQKKATGIETFTGFDRSDLDDGDDVPPALQFNIFNPDYTLVPEPGSLDEYESIYALEDKNTQYGGTVQMLLRPTERLSILAGGRYSVSKQLSLEAFDETVAGARASLANDPDILIDNIKTEKFTLQLGLTYAITEDINFYASYGETFSPEFALAYDAATDEGVLVDPEQGVGYEFGFKGDIGNDLSFSLAAFQMERKNISQPHNDRSLALRGFVEAVGTQRSRGIELDFSGELLPGLNVIGSFAYLDAKFVEGQFTGFRPPNAPKFGASLFAGYQFEDGELEGLGFGSGFVYKSNIITFDGSLPIGDDYATYNFGSTAELDARIYYERENWEVDFSVTNITNTKYYSPAFIRLQFGINVNPPRQFRLGFSYKM